MISTKFHSWAKGWRVFLLFLAEALMGYIMLLVGGIMALAANNSVMPLDLMFFYTPEAVSAMMDKYGEAGRSIYLRIELTADIIYPIIYTLFFGLLISWLFQRAFKPDSTMQKWNVMPVGSWLFNMLENVGIVSMLMGYPSKDAIVAGLTMIFGALKWAFFVITLGLVLVGFVRAALNRFRKQAELARA
jgi:hypothetical protein